jgi:hypothetical protein
LTWGTYEAAVDPELSIDVENILGILGASDDIVIRDVAVSEPTEAVAQLKAAVDASPHKSLLIVLWGYKERFDTAALKTAYFAYSLDIDTPVLLFDWPSRHRRRRNQTRTHLVDCQQPGMPSRLRRLFHPLRGRSMVRR